MNTQSQVTALQADALRMKMLNLSQQYPDADTIDLMVLASQATASTVSKALELATQAIESLMDEQVGTRATNWGSVNTVLVEIAKVRRNALGEKSETQYA